MKGAIQIKFIGNYCTQTVMCLAQWREKPKEKQHCTVEQRIKSPISAADFAFINMLISPLKQLDRQFLKLSMEFLRSVNSDEDVEVLPPS